MTDKNLRRLSRQDLLELLVQQEQQNEILKEKIIRLENRLNSRTIEIDNAGSIAEAALVLNGVFESAEKAAEQYLENIKRCSEQKEKIYLETVRAAEQKASEIIRAAEEESNKEIKRAKSNCRKIYRQIELLSREHPEIKDWIAKSN